MAGQIPASSPSPYGRASEAAEILTNFDANNAARAQAYSDYRQKQMGLIGDILGQTAAMGKLYGGMQTGALQELYLNSGLVGQGAPTLPEGALTGAFTSGMDDATLMNARRVASGSGGKGDEADKFAIYDAEGNFVRTYDEGRIGDIYTLQETLPEGYEIRPNIEGVPGLSRPRGYEGQNYLVTGDGRRIPLSPEDAAEARQNPDLTVESTGG